MLKVLHISTGNLYGGIEILLATLARSGALEPGLSHEFALGSPGKIEQELRDEGAAVHLYGKARLSRPWTVARARRRMREIIDAARPDVAITHSTWPHTVFAPAVRRAGVGLAFWLHDMYNPGLLMDRASRLTKPDVIIANSRFNGEASAGRQFPGVPWEANPSASPAPRIADVAAVRRNLRRELGTAEDATVIVQTSRFDRWKGHTQFIDAATRLRDLPGWEIWLCGGVQRPHEQGLVDELKATAAAGGIADRVKYLGQRSDVPHVLASADIHCQANLSPEPLGLTFVEALYAGLPCVSMRMGGAREIITEECGILVPPGDVEGVAAALRTLILDPSHRARLGAAGPARARALCDPALHLRRLRQMLEPIARRRAGVAPRSVDPIPAAPR